MALTKHQRNVAKTLIKIGKKRKESPKKIVTALTTGLTEYDLQHKPGGDADSSGWRQERAMYYGGFQRNMKPSVNRFYDELDAVGESGSIGGMAQAVQRSAYPSRYAENIPEARAILKQLNQGGLGKTATAARRGKSTGDKQVKTTKKVTPATSGMSALSLIQNRFEPGAFVSYAEATKPVTKTKVKTVKGRQVKPAHKGEKPKLDIPKSKGELSGGAIDIGNKVAKMFGLTVTSTTGGSHVAGSYHYQGRAVDISGSVANMKKAARYIRGNVPHAKLTEFFFDHHNAYFDNGQKIKGKFGDHGDHIHLAI